VIERFARLPASLAEKSRVVRLPGPSGPIPALLCHPDFISAAPTVLWLHGRTAYKELDSGRFLRLVRAGIAAVAIDAPGHGERRDERSEKSSHTLGVLAELLPEIDATLEALADPVYQGVFDLDRAAIGGMSMGGMAALRRLCEQHEFRCASVESTCGDLAALYDESTGFKPFGLSYPASVYTPLSAAAHLATFTPLPLLALHSRADAVVPWPLQSGFLDALREHYRRAGVDPGLIVEETWESTGAPDEHSGFGLVAAEAKSVQLEFFRTNLF
jgi:alpha-beta hydrolase superfamily lysophospholipase